MFFFFKKKLRHFLYNKTYNRQGQTQQQYHTVQQLQQQAENSKNPNKSECYRYIMQNRVQNSGNCIREKVKVINIVGLFIQMPSA